MKSASIRGLGAVLALGAIASTAFGGNKLTHEVTFDVNKPFARGNVGDARNSADTVQYIGCAITPTNATCYAINSAGVSHSCSTTDPGMLDAIRSIHADSYLSFRWEDVTGNCTTITVYNDSRYAPK